MTSPLGFPSASPFALTLGSYDASLLAHAALCATSGEN
jgi:hypothetical protein